MAGVWRKSRAGRVHTFPASMWMSWGQPDLPSLSGVLTADDAELK
jgi:hypothetical protein